jgi:NADH-quinone oxidoreductase subunit F
MLSTPRVLDPDPITSLADYESAGGGAGLRAAVEGGGDATLAALDASGLRGRGGAGFPTATKWRSVLEYAGGSDLPPKVVVNAAEGEPGTFKDRSIIRANPYRVLEGALIAAVTVGASEVVVATKARFGREVTRLWDAIAELADAGWAPDVEMTVVEGPEAYLFGEETALLEVVEGRQPFPRVAPPWRRGVDDLQRDGATAGGPSAGHQDAVDAPTVVNNVETLANVALIAANGPEWFRELGTADCPGTVVCTVSGHTKRSGVVEVPMGTPLRAVLDEVGGGARTGEITGVLSGVSNRLLPATALDTPLTYEDLRDAGGGLGSAGFIAFDSSVDPVAVAQGVSRFLAVESCGQCTPCKQDGQAISGALDRIRSGQAAQDDLVVVERNLGTVETGARCFLATQHQMVVESFLELYPDSFIGHARGTLDATAPYLIAEMTDLSEGPNGVEAVVDIRQRDKQPDWTFDATDSGQSPADRLDQQLDAADRR